MKVFEKWNSQYSTPKQQEDDPIASVKNLLKRAREDAWIAALEWVKKEAISLDERGDSNRTVINRELEEN